MLGYLDDLIVLPLLAILAIKFTPAEIMKECKAEAEDMWKDGKPNNWYYAIPTIILWLLVTGWIISKFLR